MLHQLSFEPRKPHSIGFRYINMCIFSPFTFTPLHFIFLFLLFLYFSFFSPKTRIDHSAKVAIDSWHQSHLAKQEILQLYKDGL